MTNWKGFWTKSTLVGLGLGQLLSLLLTFAGFTSSQLAKKGIFAPASQCLLIYLLLALVYGGIMIYRRQPPKANRNYYSMLAFVDVFAKYFVIMAYSFISPTSIMLLDCWAVPCVLFLSSLHSKTKYEFQKLIGLAICFAACLVAVALSDPHSIDSLTGVKLFMGDLLFIFGATFYSVSGFSQEIFAKKVDQVEIMAFLGYYGLPVIAPQIAMYERNEFKAILSSPGTIFLVIGFSIATFLFYSGVPLLLKIGGSTMLNLSLLTSNIWVVLIQNFAYHEKVNWIYFVAFATVTFGLIIYSWEDEMMDPKNGEAASIDEKANLGHSDNVRISNNDGYEASFQGTKNSLCHKREM